MDRSLSARWVPLLLTAVLAAGCGGGGEDTAGATPTDGASVQALTTQVQAGRAPDLTAVEEQREVTSGDTVSTDPAGLAELRFADGSLARLARTESLVLTELTAAAVQRTRQKLTVGDTWHRVQDLTGEDAAYEIETPVGVAAVRGTTFTLVCDDAPSCVLTVLEGTVEFTPLTGDAVELEAFQRLTFTNDGPDGEPAPVSADTLREDPFTADNIQRDGLDELYDDAPEPVAVGGLYRGLERFAPTDEESPFTWRIDCAGDDGSDCTLTEAGVTATGEPRQLQQQGPGRYTYDAPDSPLCGGQKGILVLDGETMTLEFPRAPRGGCVTYTFTGTRESD